MVLAYGPRLLLQCRVSGPDQTKARVLVAPARVPPCASAPPVAVARLWAVARASVAVAALVARRGQPVLEQTATVGPTTTAWMSPEAPARGVPRLGYRLIWTGLATSRSRPRATENLRCRDQALLLPRREEEEQAQVVEGPPAIFPQIPLLSSPRRGSATNGCTISASMSTSASSRTHQSPLAWASRPLHRSRRHSYSRRISGRPSPSLAIWRDLSRKLASSSRRPRRRWCSPKRSSRPSPRPTGNST